MANGREKPNHPIEQYDHKYELNGQYSRIVSEQSDKCEKKKTYQNYSHFEKANLQIPIEQAIKDKDIQRQLHKQPDEAVLKAYGWADINLVHDFYEVNYILENDRIRYTIPPKEILKRLLELNHKIHAEEVATSIFDNKNKKKEKAAPQKAKDEGNEKLFWNEDEK